MIIARVNGGLGNQLFQYAAARRVADRLGVDLALDLSAFQRRDPAVTPRPFELDVLHVRYRVATEDDLAPFLKRRRSRWWRSLQRLMPSAGHRWLAQQGTGYDRRMGSVKDNTYLDGHWQSDRYFAADQDRLRNDLRFHGKLADRNAELAERMLNTMCVSVHVRRGDYVTDPNASAFHHACDVDYYITASEMILERIPRAEFHVFSDDLPWVRENLRIAAPMHIVDQNAGAEGYRDMHLMSLCKHHIIANSSFSWWGAWLNPDPEKTVIAPNRWFRDPAIDTTDLIPKAWIRL